MIEGSGSESIPLTNGSGSGSRRPKNIRIRRIRIRNTDGKPPCLIRDRRSRPPLGSVKSVLWMVCERELSWVPSYVVSSGRGAPEHPDSRGKGGPCPPYSLRWTIQRILATKNILNRSLKEMKPTVLSEGLYWGCETVWHKKISWSTFNFYSFQA